MDDGISHQPESGGRRTSVERKLRNSFIGLSLFTLLSAMVGLVSYEIIETAQDDVVDGSVPAVQIAERLASEVLLFLVTSPALLAATDAEILEAQFGRIAEKEAIADQLLADLRPAETSAAQLDGIQQTLATIFGSLGRQYELVVERERLRAAFDQAILATSTQAELIFDAVQPAIINSSAAMLENADAIRDAMSDSGQVTDAIRDRFDLLTDGDFYKLRLLTDIRLRTERIQIGAEELALGIRPDQITIIRDRINLDIRTLARAAAELTDRELQREIGQALAKLRSLTEGESSLFMLRRAIIEIRADIDQLTGANETAARGLQVQIDALVAEFDALNQSSIANARSAIALARIALIGIAVVSLIAAALIIWRFVIRDIVGRLRRLANITNEISSGDLEANVDVAGTDELGDMADALRVFKANAIALRRNNAELEQFAYIASHDLKAPLRAISNLTEWLEEDLEAVMTAESAEHIKLMKSRIARLEKLLEDLLLYSRTGRRKARVEQVDLNEIVHDVFQLVMPHDQFTLRVESRLPTINTATTPLETVLRNLFSNIAKHHDSDAGTVTIDWTDAGERLRLSVADDGPGIAPEHHERVFGMFLTLKGRDEVEGSGMGLALLKKLVDSVHCTINVDPTTKLGVGTTIVFTWPKHWPSALSET